MEVLGSRVEICERRFRDTLGRRKPAIFDDEVLPFLQHQESNPHDFDLSILQRWILWKVFDLGWTDEQFGDFDRYVTTRDHRHTDKPERIGKKYQWINYHEILARVSDNFKFVGEYWARENEHARYEGPWQRSMLRNIAPSFLLEESRPMEERPKLLPGGDR
jgi:hypothetical protein